MSATHDVQQPHHHPIPEIVIESPGPRLAPSEPGEPEGLAPVAPPSFEDDEPTPDLGGPVVPSPTVEQVAEASGTGSLADKMRARFASMDATKEFGVPGWELEDGSPGLILVARAFGDRKGFNAGVANEVFIAKSTHQLLFVDDDGEKHEIPGGWGPALADMIGAPHVKKAADLVSRVISKPDPRDPSRRITNVAGIGALAQDLVEWARKSRSSAEDDLGE
jgi:hypothetical protein